MFKAIRIAILLMILVFVAIGSWLAQARSTDWNNSLWVKVYPINADGSDVVDRYIANLEVEDFAGIEEFVARETRRYGRTVNRPLRMELGRQVREQPPTVDSDGGVLGIMAWSLKLRWWASSTAGDQDRITPDVRIFVRYHNPEAAYILEDSVGLQKGMVGIVNARAGRRHVGANNVIIAHEFMHTLGASDKYDLATGLPLPPHGLGEPDRKPLYPQRWAEIMGGRIALAEDDAVVPKSLRYVVIGPLTAHEIRLTEENE
ncbi:MAG: hypothetical protein QNJ23_05375 [Woeseiaceae bacterium]|nr:hypothetical protein [Woeseiaceae bacterium]